MADRTARWTAAVLVEMAATAMEMRTKMRTAGGGKGSTKTNDRQRGLDEDEDEDCSDPGQPLRLYRGTPFSTGPWLEPVPKGL